ncbi:uncharacterized protein LOC115565524 isoform X2 [Drosophila navojoa]|nr:uncharacterized protein LOC115565524 isoform X2 [Drosophila navojoa]
MYKFDSVVEVVRLHIYSSPGLASGGSASSNPDKVEGSSSAKSLVSGIVGEAIEKAERPERRELPPAVIRITLASMDEYNILLQNGLNFYDATFFPTEANISLKGAKIDYKRR